MRWFTLAAVAAPPLVLAAIGITHPHELTPGTAEWWTNMHVVLLPLFPLLAVCQWLLLRGIGGVLAWTSRVTAFMYIAFYGALDALAGIGTGTLVQEGLDAGAGHHGTFTGRDPAITWLFVIGNDLGDIGSYAFIAASALSSVVVFLKAGMRALPGGVVLIAASVLFSLEHIYWPGGVVAMLGLAAGFGLLAWALPVPARSETPEAVAV